MKFYHIILAEQHLRKFIKASFMKILYSCLSKSWGGMEMLTITSIKQLRKRNIEVTLLCSSESRIHTEANSLGIIIHPLNSKNLKLPLNILKLRGILRNSNFNIVHTHASNDLWLLVPSLKLSKKNIPLFLTKHVGSYIIKKDNLHKIIYRRVTKVFAISKVISENLIETCPLDESKVTLLHNGIDVEKFKTNIELIKSGRLKQEVSEDEILIGMMGRFSPGKGHEEFLQTAKELNKKHDNLKFIIIGEASRGEDKYAKKIKKSAITNNIKNIIFTGYLSDVRETLSAMDIFIFPSHAEAFGLALAEAMAMELPTVCSDSDGVLDIAVDGETSFLFENKNASDLTKKMELLINSKEKRISFGKNGRERIVNNFNLETQTDKVIEIYDSYK